MTHNSCRNVLLAALETNNSAAQNIEDCSYGAAVVSLTTVLQACRDLSSRNIGDDMTMDGESSAQVLSLDCCMRTTQLTRSLDSQTSANALFKSYGMRSPPIYTCAISVPLAYKERIDKIGVCRFSMFLGCIANFNLSLVLQLAANQPDSDSKQSSSHTGMLLQKAARLYQLGLSFQEQRVDMGEEKASLFTLASVNNLGVIHKNLEQVSKAKECFEFLWSKLIYLVSVQAMDMGKQDELEVFFRNASQAMAFTEAAPAA